MRDQAFYFGCYGDKGHYFWTRGMDRSPYGQPDVMKPFIDLIDGGFLPHESVQQGRAWLSHVGDWTFLAFVDNSIDTRPGSHSTFVQSGRLGYDEMVVKAKADFPEVWARFKFEVYQAEPDICLNCHARHRRDEPCRTNCVECGLPPGITSGPHCIRCGRVNGGG